MAVNRFRSFRVLPRVFRKQVFCLLRNVAAVGLGLGLASNCAFGQLTQLGGLGQTGGLGGQLGGQLGGLGQTGQTLGMGQVGGQGQVGGLGQIGSSAQTPQANQPTANPFGSGGILGLANSFGGMAGAAGANRGIQNGVQGMGLGMGIGMGMNRGGFMGGGMGGRSQMNSFNQNQNQKSNKPQVRATVKLAFQAPVRSSEATTRLINDRFKRIPSPALEGVSVEMSGRTAVIRGEVGSPEDGKVVERLLSLEPGVDAVVNELTYADGTPSVATSKLPVPPPPRLEP